MVLNSTNFKNIKECIHQLARYYNVFSSVTRNKINEEVKKCLPVRTDFSCNLMIGWRK